MEGEICKRKRGPGYGKRRRHSKCRCDTCRDRCRCQKDRCQKDRCQKDTCRDRCRCPKDRCQKDRCRRPKRCFFYGTLFLIPDCIIYCPNSEIENKLIFNCLKTPIKANRGLYNTETGKLVIRDIETEGLYTITSTITLCSEQCSGINVIARIKVNHSIVEQDIVNTENNIAVLKLSISYPLTCNDKMCITLIVLDDSDPVSITHVTNLSFVKTANLPRECF